MDGSSFDAFTRLLAVSSRRRVAQAAAAAALAALGAASFPSTDATAGRKARRRRRRKKDKERCRDLGEACTPGTKPKCCQDLVCGTIRDRSGDRCCGDEGASCDNDADCCGDQTYCNEGTCAPCPFACAAGERCVHGTCTCDPFANTCPNEADGQCSCGAAVRIDPDEFLAACVDRNSACDLDKPCDSHDDCPPGSVCLLGCSDPPDPQPNRCSNPCVPV